MWLWDRRWGNYAAAQPGKLTCMRNFYFTHTSPWFDIAMYKKSNTLKFEFASKVKGGSLHVQTDYILTFLVGFVSFCLFGHFPVVGNYRPFEAFPGLFGAIFSTITNPCKKAPRQAAAAPVRLCWRLLASVADRLASSTQARLPWLFVFLSCLKVIQAQWLDWQTDCETIKR